MISRAKSARHARFQVAVPVVYRCALNGRADQQGSSGLTYDVSVSGVALDIPENLPIRTSVAMDLALGSRHLAVHGGVVWVRRPVAELNAFRHGVAFSALEDDESDALAEFFREHAPVATRMPLADGLKAILQAGVDARVVECSSTGACIEHCGTLRPDTRCRLTLVHAHKLLSLSAIVVRTQVLGVDRSRDEGIMYQTGVVFAELTPGQREDLRVLIAACGQEYGLCVGRSSSLKSASTVLGAG